MTKAEMESYLKAARRHYGELDGKTAKDAFLDQFCETTGTCRKNAIRRLSSKERPRVKRGRPFKASMPERDLLVRIWNLAGMPCGRLLKPTIVFWIRSLRRAGESISPKFEAALAGISASTIDRRLLGFGRFVVREVVEAMNDVARLQSLYDMFRPALKLQSKTQAGHKYRKKFEREAKTPAQRVLDDPKTSEECKRRVISLLGGKRPDDAPPAHLGR